MEEKNTVKQTSAKATKASASHEPRNFLATFLLVLGLGQFGVNRLYTGDTTVGFTRLILGLGGLLLSPFIIGIPMMLVAQVWGFIDIFVVYNGSRTDADGVKLQETARDIKVAKFLYILFIISIILVVAIVALVIILAATGAINTGTDTRLNNDYNHYDWQMN